MILLYVICYGCAVCLLILTFKITMEPMDIDGTSSSLPSSSSFEMKDFLSQGQLTRLNNNMTLIWQNSIVAAEVVVPTSAMVESFDKGELEHWKVVMQNCVKNYDWVDLICTCISDY
jgi:hypothetical protein